MQIHVKLVVKPSYFTKSQRCLVSKKRIFWLRLPEADNSSVKLIHKPKARTRSVTHLTFSKVQGKLQL